jgi:hypothetical protein
MCPCCLFGRNAKAITDENCISNCLCYLFCCPLLQHSGLRRKIRNKWNLPEDPCNDCCVAFLPQNPILNAQTNKIEHELGNFCNINNFNISNHYDYLLNEIQTMIVISTIII